MIFNYSNIKKNYSPCKVMFIYLYFNAIINRPLIVLALNGLHVFIGKSELHNFAIINLRVGNLILLTILNS